MEDLSKQDRKEPQMLIERLVSFTFLSSKIYVPKKHHQKQVYNVGGNNLQFGYV